MLNKLTKVAIKDRFNYSNYFITVSTALHDKLRLSSTLRAFEAVRAARPNLSPLTINIPIGHNYLQGRDAPAVPSKPWIPR
jgi:hypothetical protein